MARCLICESRMKRTEEMVEPVEELCDGVENVNGSCYLGMRCECQSN